jgi:hypothetical protein
VVSRFRRGIAWLAHVGLTACGWQRHVVRAACRRGDGEGVMGGFAALAPAACWVPRRCVCDPCLKPMHLPTVAPPWLTPPRPLARPVRARPVCVCDPCLKPMHLPTVAPPWLTPPRPLARPVRARPVCVCVWGGGLPPARCGSVRWRVSPGAASLCPAWVGAAGAPRAVRCAVRQRRPVATHMSCGRGRGVLA